MNCRQETCNRYQISLKFSKSKNQKKIENRRCTWTTGQENQWKIRVLSHACSWGSGKAGKEVEKAVNKETKTVHGTRHRGKTDCARRVSVSLFFFLVKPPSFNDGSKLTIFNCQNLLNILKSLRLKVNSLLKRKSSM